MRGSGVKRRGGPKQGLKFPRGGGVGKLGECKAWGGGEGSWG